MTANNGLAARLRQRADELDAAERHEREQAAAMGDVMSFAYSVFLARRHSARREIDFRAAVQSYKDLISFKGRFVKGSDEWHAMLAATDPVYRRLELARHFEKHAKGLLTKAWRAAGLRLDDASFWGVAARMKQVDAEGFLREYLEKNRAAADIFIECDAGDEDGTALRRAQANAQAAAELLAEIGIAA
jgi:hypothetical protein